MKLGIKTWALAMVVSALLLGGASLHPVAAQQGPGVRVESKSGIRFREAFRPVIANVTRSTVRILSSDGDSRSLKEVGLGTVVAQDGFILTKYSELSSKVVVRLRTGAEYEARLVGVQDQFDLAMLKINASGLTPVKWSDSKLDPVGNFVASVGMGDLPVAVGVISVAARKMPALSVADGTPNPKSGYLGIGLANDYLGKGAKVGQVMDKEAAQKANIQVNDIIVAIGNKKIETAEALIETLQLTKPGDTIMVTLFRGEEQIELQVTLGKRSNTPNRADMQNNMGSRLSNRKAGFPVVLQHDSVIQPEDCGGPLVDLEGRVIGINISRVGRVETDAIPAEALRPLLPDLMSGKLAPKSP